VVFLDFEKFFHFLQLKEFSLLTSEEKFIQI